MKETDCDYKIVAFVDGERKVISCDPKNGCLRKLVWSGIGVKAVAARILGRTTSVSIEAYVEGNCLDSVSSDSTSG